MAYYAAPFRGGRDWHNEPPQKRDPNHCKNLKITFLFLGCGKATRRNYSGRMVSQDKMKRLQETMVHIYSSAPFARKSVLVIDDKDDLLALLKTVLEMDNYEVFTARGASEAFKVLSEINKLDLIYLDVLMADVSGPDFLLALEEKMPALVREVPVVFLTNLDKVPKSKAVGFMPKPVDIDVFLKATQRFIESGTGHSLHD